MLQHPGKSIVNFLKQNCLEMLIAGTELARLQELQRSLLLGLGPKEPRALGSQQPASLPQRVMGFIGQGIK